MTHTHPAITHPALRHRMAVALNQLRHNAIVPPEEGDWLTVCSALGYRHGASVATERMAALEQALDTEQYSRIAEAIWDSVAE